MYSQFNVAVAGTGFIGPVHIEALQRLGVNVKGVLGRSLEKGERVKAIHGLEKAYTSFDEILADSTIDAVHLAVPNVLHYEMSKKALLAGKHVMCEKPLAMNTKETAELVQIANENGLTAGVCYNIRYYPLNLEAYQRVQSGDIGQVFAVTGSYVQDWLLYDTDYNWRVLTEQGGALRAVADIGTHWMDLIFSITGFEVEAVLADLATVYPVRKRPKGEVTTYSDKQLSPDELEEVEIKTEDCGSILFRFKGGGKGQLWVSQVTAGRKNRLCYEISGAKKALAWDSENPNALWMGHRGQANQVMTKDPSLLDPTIRHFANYPGGHNEGFPDTFKQCFRAFYDAIREGTPAATALYPTFAQGHKEVLLCEAILKSHQEERWVKIANVE